MKYDHFDIVPDTGSLRYLAAVLFVLVVFGLLSHQDYLEARAQECAPGVWDQEEERCVAPPRQAE